MSPEDEWLASELRRDRERRAWREAFQQVHSSHPRGYHNRGDKWVLLFVLVMLVWGLLS